MTTAAAMTDKKNITTKNVLLLFAAAAVLLSLVAVVAGCESEADRARADLSVKVFTAVLLMLSAVVAVNTYRRNVQTERAKWLNQLHEKFFEKDTYKDIRIILDSRNEDYEKLKSLVAGHHTGDAGLQEKLVIYLNFFEYVATLKTTKQIDDTDAHMLFGYYIQNLGRHDWLIAFANNNGFKNLTALIRSNAAFYTA